MTSLGIVHTVFAIVALLGAGVLLVLRKGTPWHRRLGWLYLYSMVGLNATALAIYHLSGRFGPFHVAAIFSLLTIGAGAMAAVRRRPSDRWLAHHYYWMTYSYVGLVAAAVAEVVTRLRIGGFWWTTAIASAVVLLVGGRLVNRRAAVLLPRMARARTSGVI